MHFNTAQGRINEFFFLGTPLEALTALMNTSPKLLETSEHCEISIPDSIQDAVSEVLKREPPF
jgi:hypothetical protein